jgi:hypothetical protein
MTPLTAQNLIVAATVVLAVFYLIWRAAAVLGRRGKCGSCSSCGSNQPAAKPLVQLDSPKK